MSWLRLCYVILEEIILATCKKSNYWHNREYLDRHNSKSRSKKHYEIAASAFNGPSFKTYSNAYPDFTIIL